LSQKQETQVQFLTAEKLLEGNCYTLYQPCAVSKTKFRTVGTVLVKAKNGQSITLEYPDRNGYSERKRFLQIQKWRFLLVIQ
jgi:hypothetical protein